jgi:hypothetical protein
MGLATHPWIRYCSSFDHPAIPHGYERAKTIRQELDAANPAICHSLGPDFQEVLAKIARCLVSLYSISEMSHLV